MSFGMQEDLQRLAQLRHAQDDNIHKLFSEAIPDWVNTAMADLQYLLRMRELERQLEEDSFQEKVLDVVPISGLIMSQFVRFENELKTALELWDNPSRGI